MKLIPAQRKGAGNLGLTRVAVRLKSFVSGDSFQAQFLVDTGATDSVAPASELRRIGIQSIGKMTYELATGAVAEYEFGLAEISFMNETTAGRVIFGPDNVEPILGVTALESVGVIVDATNLTLRRLPAISLK
jgi:clan AA aspartic protease